MKISSFKQTLLKISKYRCEIQKNSLKTWMFSYTYRRNHIKYQKIKHDTTKNIWKHDMQNFKNETKTDTIQ